MLQSARAKSPCPAKLSEEPKEFGKSRGNFRTVRYFTDIAARGLRVTGESAVMSHFGTGDAVNNALVRLAPTNQETASLRCCGRPHADFIAHLIATSTQEPQTRARRRAAPEQASAAYNALRRLPAVPGRALSRSL